MLAVFNIIAPIFFIIALGYMALRLSLLTREQISGLGSFVIRIGMPALIFNALTTRSIDEVVDVRYLIAYAMASVIGFAAGWYGTLRLSGNKKFAALNGMAFGMANSGFVGYPLLAMVLGNEKTGGFFAMNVLVEMVLVLPTMFILLDLADGKQKNIGATIKRIILNFFKNPMMLALFAGLIVAFAHIPVPQSIHKTAALLSAATSPLALFVIGAGLYGLVFEGRRSHMVWAAAIRMALFPILVSGCLWLSGASPEVVFAGTLFASAPVPSTYALFGRENGLGQQTAAIAMASTVLALLPITLVLLLWH